MNEGKRISVLLPDGWGDYSSENPDGPATFLRDLSEVPGAFQVSSMLYTGGEAPNPSCDDLIKLAKETGETMRAGEVVETPSGECRFGVFGSVVFRSAELPHTQVWQLSNGRDIILATHVCAEVAEAQEVKEAATEVLQLRP